MRHLVIDADAFVAWFTSDGEPRALRDEYAGGMLSLTVPPSFTADVLEIVARMEWPEDRLERLGGLVGRVGFDVRNPSVATVARWVGSGLGASRAAYAALAEETERPLIAGDPELRRLASPVLLR